VGFSLYIFPRHLGKYRCFVGRGLLKVIFFCWVPAVRKIMRIDKVTSREVVRKSCENVVRSSAEGGRGGKNTRYPGQLMASDRFTSVFALVGLLFDPDIMCQVLEKCKEGTVW
jgi:hypothetical protein